MLAKLGIAENMQIEKEADFLKVGGKIHAAQADGTGQMYHTHDFSPKMVIQNI
jgi:hypothetical protein